MNDSRRLDSLNIKALIRFHVFNKVFDVSKDSHLS